MYRKIILLLFISSLTFAQTYTIDNTFNPSDLGIYNQDLGRAGAFLNNGKLLTLNEYGLNSSDRYVNRRNIDGSVDNSYTNSPIPLSMSGMFVNKMLGNFVTLNVGTNSNEIYFNSYDINGVLITSFISPVFYNSFIQKVIFLDDGKLIVLG